MALDIKAGNPVILVPRSAKSCHMLVADLGNLTVTNGFLWEGSPGTLAYSKNRQRAQSQTDFGKTWGLLMWRDKHCLCIKTETVKYNRSRLMLWL